MRLPVAQSKGPFVEFMEGEAAGGITLMAFAVIALGWANWGTASSYSAFVSAKIPGLPAWTTLHFLVNDGLMALFFLLMSLEIKREILGGELKDRRAAALPVLAAIGGMMVPAALFVGVNLGMASPLRDIQGAGIPMATDIAFSLGVLALLGSRVPTGLKLLLATIAIVDDLGAIVVIALFYSAGVKWLMLGGMAGCTLLLLALNRLRVSALWPYLVMGLPLWGFTMASGLHATLSGVVLALTIPYSALTTTQKNPLLRLEHALGPWVNFAVLPLFALVNAGVHLTLHSGDIGVSAGIIVGLVLGKPLGIFIGAWIGVRIGLCALPQPVEWPHVAGVGMLAGIGFTMSLFIAELAFGHTPNIESAKIAILGASVLSAILGSLWLLRTGRRAEAPSKLS